jgi:GT2 family glycosyltransferase
MPLPSSAGAARDHEELRVNQTRTIAVVVPSHRRPAALKECVLGLARQLDPADEIIIVVRASDAQSRAVVQAAGRQVPNLHEVIVDGPGVVAALKAGSDHACADLIAFTDDDAIPPPGWTRALRMAFERPDVGLVGGRDVMQAAGSPDCSEVGRISRWGRMVGNHDRGMGPPRNVDVLKGVNMAVRARALRLPLGLRGDGAQPHWEVAVCLAAARGGWMVSYDPAIAVDHFPGDRGHGDERELRNPMSVFNEAFNYHVALAGIRPRLARRALVYGVVIGTTRTPGVVRWLAALLRRERHVMGRLGPSMRGKLAGHRAGRTGGLQLSGIASAEAPTE